MTAVVIGATAGLGRALCAQIASQGQDLILVASDARDLDALRAHLSVTFEVQARVVCCDVADAALFEKALGAELEKVTQVSALFVPLGVSSHLDTWEQPMALVERHLTLNFLSAVRAIQAVLPRLSDQKGARIVGFGSIATIRARSRNMSYTAAKCALASYFASLRHAMKDKPVAVQFYQMGFIETQQFYGHASPFPAIAPEVAARRIMRDGPRDFGSRYLPGYWAGVAVVLRCLPWSVFKRLDF